MTNAETWMISEIYKYLLGIQVIFREKDFEKNAEIIIELNDDISKAIGGLQSLLKDAGKI